MRTEDLTERYRRAQMSQLPDYRDGFDDGHVSGKLSMRWWVAAAFVVGFALGIVIGAVL